MKNEQIFSKALAKATDNGWDRWNKKNHEKIPFPITLESANNVIFSHDFAKAFFGTQRLNEVVEEEAWKFHIVEMVLNEDPIKYLEQFL